jgi:flagellar hook protein FlgE
VLANRQPDLAESLVGLTQGRNEVQASARVVETADEVLGTLIDTRA